MCHKHIILPFNLPLSQIYEVKNPNDQKLAWILILKLSYNQAIPLPGHPEERVNSFIKCLSQNRMFNMSPSISRKMIKHYGI